MTDDTWFYRAGEVEVGPTSRGDLASLVRAGALTATSSMRRAGESAWASASEALPDLFEAPPIAPPAVGWRDIRPHPWRRLLARNLDIMIVGGITWALVGVVAYSIAPQEADNFFKAFNGPGGRLLDGFLTVLAAIPGNALMIGLTGISIGKWIFGIRVLKNGAPMGFSAALEREFTVWFKGLGMGLPIVSLVTLVRANNRLESKGRTSWDQDQGLTVVHRPESGGATALMWCGGAAIILFRIWLQVLASS